MRHADCCVAASSSAVDAARTIARSAPPGDRGRPTLSAWRSSRRELERRYFGRERHRPADSIQSHVARRDWRGTRCEVAAVHRRGRTGVLRVLEADAVHRRQSVRRPSVRRSHATRRGTARGRDERGQPACRHLRATTMRTMMARTVANERYRATLSSAFGGAALLLAAIGLFGLLTRAVNERRREIGVRMAVGAKPGDVVRSGDA